MKEGFGARQRLLFGAAVLAMLLPDMVAAQEAPPPTQAGIGDIIVTAQRREERAQDVPISITALSSDAMRERNITKLQDLQASVPSLVVAPNGQASRDVMSPSIRGQSTSFQGAPAVVVYMNEVPLPNGIMFSTQGGPGNYIDLENIQVLSGPQGTLFGRNTTGGAILLTPKKPTDQLEGSLSGSFGTHNLAQFEAVLNVPVSDKVRLRIVGATRDRDGYTYDVNWHKDRDDSHMRMVRVGLEIDPVDGVNNYTMAYYGQSHSNGTGVILRGYNTPYFQQLDSFVPTFDFCRSAGNCDYYTDLVKQQQDWGTRKVAHGVDDFTRNKSWGVNNTTNIDITENVTLRNIISYATLKSTFANDQDGSIAPVDDTGNTILSHTQPTDNYRLFTEELQIQGSALNKKLTYTVGGMYYHQTPGKNMATFATSVCSNKSPENCQVAINRMQISNKSKALYAQGTFDFGALTPTLDRLRLTGGFRYTWDEVSGTISQYTVYPGVSGGRCNWNGQLAANPLPDCRFEASLKSSKPTWLIGLDYRPVDDLMLYAKVTRGYKAGGLNSYAVFPDTRTFGPEIVTDYELGFKSNFTVAGMPTVFNVNGFYMDYSNIQRGAPDRNPATNTSGAVILSSASAVIKGVEIEGTIKPIPEIDLGFNYSHIASHYKSFIFNSSSGVRDCTATSPSSPLVFNGVNMTCRPLQYLSPNILSVHGNFTVPVPESVGELSLFLSYNWSDKQHTAPLAVERYPDGQIMEPGVDLPSFGLLNASINWNNALNSGLDVSVFGTNITNKVYPISTAGVYQVKGDFSSIYGEPAMYGVNIRYRFGGAR